MGFGGYVIWFGVVDYNGRATCTGSQSPLVKNRSEPQDLVRRLPVCVGTVNTGGSMGIRHASVWWRVGLRGVGSWQYNVVRKLRHSSLCRICAVIPRTPVHSVIRIPSINFIMNTTTTTTSTATTNAATSRPSISSMVKVSSGDDQPDAIHTTSPRPGRPWACKAPLAPALHLTSLRRPRSRDIVARSQARANRRFAGPAAGDSDAQGTTDLHHEARSWGLQWHPARI